MKLHLTTRERLFFLIFIFTVVFFLYPAAASASEGLMALRGTVRSQTGVSISGASVSARNRATGLAYTARSNERGQFEIQDLTPGIYELEVLREGFLSQKRAEVEIGGDQPGILELVLEPRSGSGPGGPATRISEDQLIGLPLNGRSYNQLATLQAGVTDTAGAQSSRGIGGGGLTVAGGRPTSNNFLLDGTNIMDTGNQVPRSAAGVQLGADATYQVQVFSANVGAEYGRGSGGTLNSITKSGTNELHGTVFEYLRNSRLDARKFFDPEEPPPFKRHQFGFTVTGPMRKQTTYFMGSFEAMRDRLTETDLTFLPDETTRLGTVHPAVKPYLALYPLPNLGSIGGGIGRHTAPVFLPTNENYFTVRVDQKLSNRDSLFGRYTFDDASTAEAHLFLFRTSTESRQQYLTLVETHIFSPSTLNSLRLGYTRPADFIDSPSSIVIPRSLYFVPTAPHFGQIQIPGLPTFGPFYTTPEGNTMNSFQFADDLVAQRGAHGLKFGTEVHRYRWNVFDGFMKGAVWSFNSLESFLRAGPEGTTLAVALPGSDNRKGFRQTLVGFYAQDAYRASSQLLINAGLRYEFATIIREKNGRLAFLPDFAHDTALQSGPMLENNPSFRNFSPRLGLSWSPRRSGNTVLAGGFGIHYDPLLEYVIDLQKNSAPFYQSAVRVNFDSSTTFPDALAAIPFATPFQVEVLDYSHISTPMVLRYNISLQQSLPGGGRVQASYVGARGNHLHRGYEANLYPGPIRRADGSLFFPPNSGPINPAFGSIALTSTDAQSFYNALQISANPGLGPGLSLQATYSYGKSVDDASNFSSSTSAATGKQYPFERTLDRGLSDFDIRHRLTISYFYTLPEGRGQRWWKSGVVAAILGGWRLGGILSLRSGTPFHPLVNVRTPGFLFEANRPNLLPGRSNNPIAGVTAGCVEVTPGEALGGPERYFDPCSFRIPEPGTLGNAGRNTIIAPSVFNMDISLQKEFLLGAERRLQFRAEFFNLPNHTNLAAPSRGSTVLFSGVSARPNPTAGRIVRTITTARQIQFALRFSF
ncbi:MAG: TonB-dependent receptor [Acidobacteria bacterium]|nr:TonB-dependent receptor [Acidobacteriota bacterium]